MEGSKGRKKEINGMTEYKEERKKGRKEGRKERKEGKKEVQEG